MHKITVYNVSKQTKPLFLKYKPDNIEWNLVSDKLSEDNVEKAEGSEGILITGADDADKTIVDTLAVFGIKYLFTRAVGIDNIDVSEATAKGIQVANVPDYSPYSVAQLAMILGLSLFRHVSQATYNTHLGDFRVLPSYFDREIEDATIGIIGVGRIGTAEAKMYDALGAHVLGYQRHPNPENKSVEFVSLNELLEKSDIISLHIPLTKGTEKLIGKNELAKMKQSAVLINTARGGVVDTDAAIDAVANEQIDGYGTDVFLDEGQVIGKQFDDVDDIPNEADLELVKNYPNIIVTPHIASHTVEASTDMVTISCKNFESAFKTGRPIHPVNEVKND